MSLQQHFFAPAIYRGAEKIGLWGISRAGWIAPIAISKDKNIKFWISVSGVDEKETFGYLLKSNWRLEGYEDAEIEKLYGQWMKGNEIVSTKGSYEDYIEATIDLRADGFLNHLSGSDEELSKPEFQDMVTNHQTLNANYDLETGLMIYVEGFAEMLSDLDIAVLAILGEKDSIVDWRSTQQLYEETIGSNPDASLSVVTFANGNHNLHESQTGSFKEMIDILDAPVMAPGYYEAISTWMTETVLD